MGGKKRKEKKLPPVLRNKEERINEINEIKSKISLMGLTDDLGRITDIFDIMDKYIETGQSLTGSIKLEGYSRILDYIFPAKKNIKLTINIRYAK